MLDRIMESIISTVIKYAPIAIKEPDNYEARANLMWASSWAINGFLDGSKKHRWTCHAMEHELSAFYDITHGLGLAIVTPSWMEYVLDENTEMKFKTLGKNVFGTNSAKETIEKFREFFYNTLGLPEKLSEVGIDETNFNLMAEKACRGKEIYGYKTLTIEDVENIFKMCK